MKALGVLSDFPVLWTMAPIPLCHSWADLNGNTILGLVEAECGSVSLVRVTAAPLVWSWTTRLGFPNSLSSSRLYLQDIN